MIKLHFMQALDKFEQQTEHHYDQELKSAAWKDIGETMHVTADEWKAALEWLRKNSKYIPRIPAMREAVMLVRRGSDQARMRVRVSCDKCRTFGFLFRETEGERFVIGCGCENTPDTFPEENSLENLLQTGTVQREEVTDRTGRPITVAIEDWKKQTWKKTIDLYLEDKWVPRWMKERFDADEFARPTMEEYVEQGTAQAVREFKPPVIGEDVPF